MKIFIIEDDIDLSDILGKELNNWGYITYNVDNFNNILEEFRKINPDLVLMDINLPYFNGYYWTQKIRLESSIPIIFISSRNDNMDIIQAMQYGADDYITKPIDVSVTRAKIQAVLRRSYDYTIKNDKISFSSLSLNLSSAKLVGENFEINLTRTELMILEFLFMSKGEISKRESLMDHCWQNDNFIDDNTLAVNISRLRKKLQSVGYEDLIQTKKGIGYYLKD